MKWAIADTAKLKDSLMIGTDRELHQTNLRSADYNKNKKYIINHFRTIKHLTSLSNMSEYNS